MEQENLTKDQRACHYCKTAEKELRPYGPGGAWVCFPCAFETPERKAQTESAFADQLHAAGPVVMIGEETGPRPIGGTRS